MSRSFSSKKPDAAAAQPFTAGELAAAGKVNRRSEPDETEEQAADVAKTVGEAGQALGAGGSQTTTKVAA